MDRWSVLVSSPYAYQEASWLVPAYFDILESRSVRLQNQVGGILKAITFQATPNIAELEAAITRFVVTDGILDRTAPAAFLTGEERAAVWKDGKFRISL